MSNIISLSTKKIINGLYQEVYDARTLHNKLQSKKQFSDWIKNRLKDFIEGVDFISFTKNSENPNGGRPLIDYYLTEKIVISCIQESLHLSIAQKQEVLQKLNIKNYTLMTRQELEFFDTLIKILEPFNLTCTKQYKVLNYKIDLYIKELNVAIEYDEEHHKSQLKQDDSRQDKIIKEMQCMFIRVSNNDSNLWNCGFIIKQIFKLYQ